MHFYDAAPIGDLTGGRRVRWRAMNSLARIVGIERDI
jgi:hypothetical protein